MPTAHATCGLCEQPVGNSADALRHRLIHRVPDRVGPPPGCEHPLLFVGLWFGLVQIVPLVEDDAARRLPERGWEWAAMPEAM